MIQKIKQLKNGKLSVGHKTCEIQKLNLLGLLIAVLYNIWYLAQNFWWEITDHIPRHTAIHLIEQWGRRPEK